MYSIDDILDKLKKDYSAEFLLNVELSERDRLEIIYKRELIDEIENMVGDTDVR